MRNFYLSFLFIAFSFNTNSQTAFWTETFGTGCTQGFSCINAIATGTNGAWTMTPFLVPFMSGPDANNWFISAEEQGQNVGVCGGITCGGSNDRTLHMGANVTSTVPNLIDIGADYVSGPGNNTNKRVNSPLINTTGYYNIQLSFKYMAGGIPGNDYCEIEYSGDGGTTWFTLMVIPPSTYTVQCPTNGYWRAFAVGLPPMLDNNPTVKIGFHWYNNDPMGDHPSIAIDNMQLSTLTMDTNTGVNCVAATSTAAILNNAIGNTSYTWTSIPNTATFSSVNNSTTNVQYPGLGTFTLLCYGSAASSVAATSTAINVVTVGFGATPSVNATSTQSLLCIGSSATLTGLNATTYTWNPGGPGATTVVSPTVNTTYTVTGKIGYCISTKTITQQVTTCTSLNELNNSNRLTIFPNPFSNELIVEVYGDAEIIISNMLGKIMKQEKFNTKISLQTNELQSGIYILTLKTAAGIKILKAVKE